MPTDARFRQLLDAVPVLIWCTDADRRLIYFNKGWLDFTGRTAEQGLGCGWAGFVHPQDDARLAALFAAHFHRREPFRLEFRLRHQDGAWRWMLGTGVPRRAESGTFLGFIGSCVDITELKEAEAQRQRDLDEKTALLQELHHRVKNNAQVFASLLGVQANRAADPDVKAALRTAAARAATMAIALQQIHDSGAAAEFDLAGFARRLVPTLHPRRIEIALHEHHPVSVPLAAAVPLSLILHELLTNAVQHGFPAGREGRVDLLMTRKRDGTLCINVRDNGVGWHDPARPEPHGSVGLTIVKSLARQLGAALTFESGQGATVSLTLPTHRRSG